MSLFRIAWRSMWQRHVSTVLTALSMALGVALVVAVLVMVGTIDDTFRRSTQGFDIIVGAKGSSLQLVLNTMYHLDRPIENIPYSFYLELKEGQKFRKYVETAIPYCLGDNHQGYRVVGTVPELFDLDYGDGQKYQFAAGRNFKSDGFFEAVVGSIAAANCDPPLTVGSKFRPTHGLDDSGVKHDEFTVVGVLAPTGTPNDRALFVNIEGFYLLEGHALPQAIREKASAGTGGRTSSLEQQLPTAGKRDAENNEVPADRIPGGEVADAAADTEKSPRGAADGGQDNGRPAAEPEAPPAPSAGQLRGLPIENREVTAILIRTPPDNMLANISLPKFINKGNVAQAVLPTRVIFDFFDRIVGPLRWLLLFLTGMIVIVAGVGILVAILNTMNERKRDIAIMRALGASRTTVMSVVLLESMQLALLGGGLGFLLGHGMLAAIHPWVQRYTGVSLGFTSVVLTEWAVLPAILILAVLVGILPGLLAYRTDVSKALSASP